MIGVLKAHFPQHCASWFEFRRAKSSESSEDVPARPLSSGPPRPVSPGCRLGSLAQKRRPLPWTSSQRPNNMVAETARLTQWAAVLPCPPIWPASPGQRRPARAGTWLGLSPSPAWCQGMATDRHGQRRQPERPAGRRWAKARRPGAAGATASARGPPPPVRGT